MRAVAFALAFMLASPAWGAPKSPNSDDVVELRKQAEDEFKAKHYPAALDKYLEASRLTNDPALLYNIARCHHELGSFPDAHTYYTRFAVEAPADLRAKVPHLDEKIALVASKTAVLEITANVAGAAISVNGKRLVEPGKLRVNAGRVTLTATLEGYAPLEQLVDAAAGAAVVVRLNLIPKAQSATLKVQSNVKATTVTVDDALLGTTPVTATLASGSHRLVATAEGYEPWRRTVTLTPGGVVQHDVALTAKSSNWWIWAGVGVVIVSGAVITYALVTERGADSGSYDPGQVAAGIVRF